MEKKISIVVPCFNEEAGISKFLDWELLPVLEGISYKTEVVLVDDGSADKTVARIRETEVFKRRTTKLVAFSRNFGKEVALSAGLREATGSAAILIDSDGQHPVEKIPEMIEKWEAGADVVTAVSRDKKTGHKLSSRIFYAMMRRLGNKSFRADALDFRLLDRKVIEEFNKFTERNRIFRGLIDWLGFRQEFLPVSVKRRESGKPTYNFRKLVALAGDSLVSASRTPLVIFGYIGVFITVFSGLLGLFILVQQYILGDPLGLDWAGAVAMSVFVAFLVGLVLISQAITALYVSQIQIEAKNRPLYVIDMDKSKL